MKKLIITALAIVGICCLYAVPGWAQCWNGYQSSFEECDINYPCPSTLQGCDSQCECQTRLPEDVECGNQMWEVGEECDPNLSIAQQKNWCKLTTSMPPNAMHFYCTPPGSVDQYGQSNECECRYCGDNILNQPDEECDPPGSTGDCAGTSICQEDCTCGPDTSVACGNWHWQPNAPFNEECDKDTLVQDVDQCKTSIDPAAPWNNARCNGNCECEYCGDGILQTLDLHEQCEPPGVHGGPGVWSQACPHAQLPAGHQWVECRATNCTCVSAPITQQGNCGNGQLDGIEECDYLANSGDPAHYSVACTNPPNPGDVATGCTVPGPVGGGCTCEYGPSTCDDNGTLDPGEPCDPTLDISGGHNCGLPPPMALGWDRCDPGCICVAAFPPGGGPHCLDGAWANNWDPITLTGEQCDETAPVPPTPTIPLQCRLSGTPIQGPMGDCENCVCIWCGDGTINGVEVCDPNAANNPANCGTCDPNTCQCSNPVCGDTNIDAGEDCDPGMPLVQPDVTCDDGINTTDDICDHCKCTHVPSIGGPDCGNGVRDPGEECGDPDAMGVTTCPDPGEVCIHCKCLKHGERPEPECGAPLYQLDPGEDCDVDPSLSLEDYRVEIGKVEQCGDPDAYCIGCVCSTIPPPNCPPQCCPQCCCPDCQEPPSAVKGTDCIIQVNGSSTPGAWKFIKKYIDDAQDEVPQLIGKQIFAEAGFSTVSITVFLDDVVTPQAQIAGAIHVENNSVGNFAVIQRSGQPLRDTTKMTAKATDYVTIPNWVRIAPILQSDYTNLGMSLPKNVNKAVIKSIQLPDLSAAIDTSLMGPVTIDSILSLDQNVDVQSPTKLLWKIGNAVSVHMQPMLSYDPTKQALPSSRKVAGTITFVVPPDIASFTGAPGGVADNKKFYWENRYLDPKDQIADFKAEAVGMPLDAPFCHKLLNSKWDDMGKYEFTVVEDQLTDTDLAGSESMKSAAVFAMPTGYAQGAGGCRCDIGAAVPVASQLVLMLGLAASGLAGIVAVRRRRRR